MLFKGAYIRGKFVFSGSHEQDFEKKDPGNLDNLIGRWSSTLSQVDAAVMSAHQAATKWASLKIEKRCAFILRLVPLFKKYRKTLSEMISSETGKTLNESQTEVDAAIGKISITLNRGLKLVRAVGNPAKEYTFFRSRGVLAILGPFNFPFHLANGHWVPALATGNTVVFKPSELTPFTGQLVTEIMHQAGFPAGVFNTVQGGGEVGSALVSHGQVDGVLFTGSDFTGRKILETTQKDPKKICVLEMGGKNALIVWKDAPLESTLAAALQSGYLFAGQRCNALSRLFLHRSIADKFIDRFVLAVKDFRVGYFRDPKTQMGPLVSETALIKFQTYQQMAEREPGIRTLLASAPLNPGYRGYYVSPAIHLIGDWRKEEEQKGYRYDEIFGPDVAITIFDDFEEAVDLHNDCRYGLVASVFTKSRPLFNKFCQRLEVGNIYLNRMTIGAPATLPFGGIKGSGNHFPAGLFSPYYCTYPVAVQKY